MQKQTPGISVVEYTKADGSKVKKLRVRLYKQGKKIADKLFEQNEMRLATEYRSLVLAGKLKEQPTKERAAVSLGHKLHQGAMAEMEEYWNNRESFHYFCKKYIEKYVSPMSEEDERDRRNKHGVLGFLNRIQVVLVTREKWDEDVQFEHEDWTAPPIESIQDVSIEFGKIPALQIDVMDINSYISARIGSGIMSSSIQRELSFISKVLTKLPHLDRRFSKANLENPVPKYDRDLLKNNPADKRKKLLPEITAIDTTKLMDIIRAGKSSRKVEAENICKLSEVTGMRRGECVYLRQDQVNFDLGYIWLTKTKSKKPRKVYFDAAAKAFLQSLPAQKDGRYFTISIVGFDRLMKGYIKKFNENSTVKFSFHMFRKIYITKTISRIGAENSLYAGQILGLSPKWVEKIGEQTAEGGIKTQQQMLKSIDHSNPKVTNEHYMLGIDLQLQRKMMVEELKAKKRDGKPLTAEELNFLVDSLLE